MKWGPNQPCPCGRGAKYKRCCLPLHRGRPAPDPESLMRSRFAAYAAGEVEYVLATTHPVGPMGRIDQGAWEAEVRDFCRRTDFVGLEILDAGESGDTGWVRFRAHLLQAGQDASFVEHSHFVRRDGRWFYHSAGLAGGGT